MKYIHHSSALGCKSDTQILVSVYHCQLVSCKKRKEMDYPTYQRMIDVGVKLERLRDSRMATSVTKQHTLTYTKISPTTYAKISRRYCKQKETYDLIPASSPLIKQFLGLAIHPCIYFMSEPDHLRLIPSPLPSSSPVYLTQACQEALCTDLQHRKEITHSICP